MVGWMDRRGAAVAVTVVILATLLHPVAIKLRRRRHKPRSGTQEIISDGEDPKFEIVAVHGLGADPDYTWTQAVPANSVDKTEESRSAEHGPAQYPRNIHLLRDLLKPDFPEARILSFADNSNWLGDAPVKTTEEIGKSLLEEIKAKRSHRNLPIIFIGHSLGGIIIKQALCRHDAQEIIDDTLGILFLGAPHQGSSVSIAGVFLASMTGFLGSNTILLSSLKSHEGQLSNLAATFQSLMGPNINRRQKVRIISFYETKPMYYLGWLSMGLVVSRDSAVVHADEEHAIDTDHSGLNKCAGPDDKLYEQLRQAIDRLRVPSLLEQADTVIRNEHYTGDRLKIERLSGDLLPMDQCYINLAIVEQSVNDVAPSYTAQSPFSLFARQKVQTPDKTIQIELPTIFNQRKGRDSRTMEPRRILIRGRAGVGKTTLCKKMVYDFTRGAQTELYRSWKRLFDRLLWVPLRNLKELSAAGYNLENLFYDEYFAAQGNDDGHRLAKELWREVKDTTGCRTLFILDGLDEVSQDLGHNHKMSDFLMHLLNKPNVIITSRPSASIPAGTDRLDLELETIGFYPEQVKAYLEADPKIEPRANEIQSFLKEHWLIQGLVRIPIQLDALCYTWEDFKPGAVPNTMTLIYRAIERRLWKKDAVRLKKKHDGELVSASQLGTSDIEDLLKDEIYFLEGLAFTGLHNDVIDFMPYHWEAISGQFKRSGMMIDKMLPRISFLRTSDPTSQDRNKTYHFIHLTFQEYFAARYFARQWAAGKPLKCLILKDRKTVDTDPGNFFRTHKYTARYDIMWRFVAGLLDQSGHVEPFIDIIEKEPLDLLGPTHQRLVMHCLSEVPGDLPIRTCLEQKLSEWLLFECEFGYSASLATESEFPERALEAALSKGSLSVKRTILSSLTARATLPPGIIALVASWLQGEDADIRKATVEAFHTHHSALPEEILKIVAALLEDKDEDPDIRQAAAKALGCQLALPEKILKAIAARLEDADINPEIRQIAADTLGYQSALPEEILKAIAARLEDIDEDPDIRYAAAEALGHQSAWPEEILEAIAVRLEDIDEDPDIRYAAAHALRRQSALPEEILKAIAARLEGEDTLIRRNIIGALQNQLTLPEEILKAVAARLEDVDWYIRTAAEHVLRRNVNFYGTLLNGHYVPSLYKILLYRSFSEQLSWYIDDGDSCVNMPNDIRRMPTANQHNHVRAMINEARPTNFPSTGSECSELSRHSTVGDE